jgi:hypothetical protein
MCHLLPPFPLSPHRLKTAPGDASVAALIPLCLIRRTPPLLAVSARQLLLLLLPPLLVNSSSRV